MAAARMFPDSAQAIDRYLDHLAETGQETFHVRDLAAWWVANHSRVVRTRGQRLTQRQHDALIAATVPRMSTWLQDYWRRQTDDSYRYSINCQDWGPDARWDFYVGGDAYAAERRARNRFHKNLEVAFANAVERSVGSLIDDPAVREELNESVALGIELLTDEVMRVLSNGSAVG
jgi:hypothetical protein